VALAKVLMPPIQKKTIFKVLLRGLLRLLIMEKTSLVMFQDYEPPKISKYSVVKMKSVHGEKSMKLR